MKKYSLLFILTLLTLSCSKEDSFLPEQKSGYNPIAGEWISKSSWSNREENWVWEKEYTQDYRYKFKIFHNEDLITQDEYSYVIDKEKVYFENGKSNYWKIDNDTLFLWDEMGEISKNLRVNSIINSEHIVGKWRSGTLYQKYLDNHEGYLWDTSDDILEEEAQKFLWYLSGTELIHEYILVLGGSVHKYYILKELTINRLIYKDTTTNFIHSFEKVKL